MKAIFWWSSTTAPVGLKASPFPPPGPLKMKRIEFTQDCVIHCWHESRLPQSKAPLTPRGSFIKFRTKFEIKITCRCTCRQAQANWEHGIQLLKRLLIRCSDQEFTGRKHENGKAWERQEWEYHNYSWRTFYTIRETIEVEKKIPDRFDRVLRPFRLPRSSHSTRLNILGFEEKRRAASFQSDNAV